MKTNYTSKLKIDLSEDGESYLTVKSLSLNLQAKLKDCGESTDKQIDLIKSLIIDIKGVEIDDEPVSLENVGEWPNELVTDILHACLSAVSQSADASKTSESEKN
jgi:hypothetical protein